jgi:hypothetical protein
VIAPSAGAAPDPRLVAALVRSGLLGDPAEAGFEALAGGVSSDIWKVTTTPGAASASSARWRN